MVKPINIFCVYWGNKFDKRYVDRLHKSIDVPNNFYVFTEQSKLFPQYNTYPLPNDLVYWWTKLSIFDTPEIQGKCLYFDLDVDIKKSIQPFVDYKGDSFVSIWDKGAQGRNEFGYNSSIIKFEANKYKYVLEEFRKKDKKEDGHGYYIDNRYYSGDQVWLNYHIHTTYVWPDAYIAWHRQYNRGEGNQDPIAVIYHGKTKPTL